VQRRDLRTNDESQSQPDRIRDYPRDSHLDRFQLSSLARLTRSVVYVVLPAHNAASELKKNLETLSPLLVSLPGEPQPPVTSIIVVDDRSTDDTSAIAAAAGVNIVKTSEAKDVFPEYFVGLHGKGSAMAVGAIAALNDAAQNGHSASRVLLVFLDANLHPDNCMSTQHVLALATPILQTSDTLQPVSFVQSRSVRIVNGVAGAGGRVKQRYVRPLANEIATERPKYAAIASVEGLTDGEVAIRGDLAANLRWGLGYSVEMRNLLQSIDLVGVDGVAQAECPDRSKLNPRGEGVPEKVDDVRGTVDSQGERIVRTIRADLGLDPSTPLRSGYDGVTTITHVPSEGETDLLGPTIAELPNLASRAARLIQGHNLDVIARDRIRAGLDAIQQNSPEIIGLGLGRDIEPT
jgi:hypothetical protein